MSAPHRPGAAARLPGVAPAALRAAHHAAFGHLLDALTAITVLCAVAAFAFLSRVRVDDAPVGDARSATPMP
ncbi:hypothetical protein [Burkholderia sp. Ac-20379]|uniref:hypothetical protein n=1 Tax=Burkholderia sp. Ac-20379 TaxID=2703900 RepID=UPI001F11A345|nr:hypothetical protein [Burkholderia sp. Ac-20379]